MAGMVPQRRRERGAMTPSRESLGDVFDNFFDNFFAPISRQWARPWFPEFTNMRFWDFEVQPTENDVVVRAEMPGFEPDEIEVSVEQNVLTISAERRAEGKEEREYRSFYRTATLPSGIDAANVTANYRNGVLELHIPRKEEAKPKRIRVMGRAKDETKPVQAAPAAVPETGQGKDKK